MKQAFSVTQVHRANTELSAAQRSQSVVQSRIEAIRQEIPDNDAVTDQAALEYNREQRIFEIEQNELNQSRIAVEKAEVVVAEAVANRQATLLRLNTIELDGILQEYCAIWSALADVILPLMSVSALQALDADAYQTEKVELFVRLFEEKFSYKGFYMHLFKSGHVAEDVKYMQRNFPSISFTFFSAQRSEHGNKLVKLLMLNLYGVDFSQSSFAFMIVDQNTRCIYYICTCVAIGTYTCSLCGSLGHNKNNLVFH